MLAGDALNSLAAAIYSSVGADLKPVEYPETEWKPESKRREATGNMKARRPYVDEVEVVMFLQTWGSTALGFGGIGGAAMTSAYTVVVLGPAGDAVVYFAGRLAYKIERPTEKFHADLSARNMAECGKSGGYSKRDAA